MSGSFAGSTTAARVFAEGFFSHVVQRLFQSIVGSAAGVLMGFAHAGPALTQRSGEPRSPRRGTASELEVSAQRRGSYRRIVQEVCFWNYGNSVRGLESNTASALPSRCLR